MWHTAGMKRSTVIGAALWLVLGASVASLPADLRQGERATPGYDSSVDRLRAPRLIYRENPDFPGEAARAGIWDATVHVNARIQADGSVVAVDVLQCSAPGLGFEKEALRTTANWRYAPALADGRPVEVFYVITVRFHRKARTFAI